MTHFFLDSSALVKRYLPEQGTIWIRSLFARNSGNRIIVAQIAAVEVISGVSRRKREGHITAEHAHAVRQLMGRHFRDEYLTIGLTESITSQAKDLVEMYPLRAYDAVQLASALESNNRLTAADLQPLIFIASDTQLLEVAVAVGLAVENPNNH
nr:type II toxin-antitoxin system VapC family toxin [Anaerolineae bacterium]